MRILMVTLGSHGDVHPFIAIGRELNRRGHSALLAGNPYFEPQARKAGVDFTPIGEAVDLKEIMQTPGVMHPRKGARVVLREMAAPLAPEMFRRTRELFSQFKPDACLQHPICFGTAWACEKDGVPSVPVVLSPLCWMRSRDQRVFTGWRSHSPGPWTVAFDGWAARLSIRWMLDGTLNRLRRDLGLPRQRDIMVNEFSRGELVLGLWSKHFRPPCEGDPPGGRICGFTWFDDHHMHQHGEEEVGEFLAAGEPPIVFSLGSAAVFVAGGFYAQAAEAAQALGRRAMLLVGRAEFAPDPRSLPAGVRAFSYAPFSTVLLRAAATVHHGGVGSTAQALRAGRPMVVVPLAHDQFDNAARCKRLGVSETVLFKRANARTLAAALKRVFDDPATAAAAQDLGPLVAAEDGARGAADHLEQVFSKTNAVSQQHAACSALAAMRVIRRC